MRKDYYLGTSKEGFHNIAFTEWGMLNPDLPSILCLHGYTRNGRDFDALAYYLSLQGRHVLCPDVVGRGDSSWFKNAQHYTFDQYITDISALIAYSHARQIDVIGTSMGGIIGMMMAAMPNTPIRRLILNDVGAQIPVSGLKKLGLTERKVDFVSFDKAKAYFKEHLEEFGDLSEEQWINLTKHSIEQRAPDLFVSKIDPNIRNPKSSFQFISEFFHHPYKSLEGIFYDIDLWSVWNKISCPVFIIHGMHSEILTAEIIHRMKKEHSLTQVYDKENAGHAPALLDLADHERIYHWLS